MRSQNSRATPENALKVVAALTDFGFADKDLNPDLFLPSQSLIRMGYPPYRIEISTQISGVEFERCWSNRVMGNVDDIVIPILGLSELRTNKRASGRLKDLAGLEKHRLTNLEASDQNFGQHCLSPDGRYLATYTVAPGVDVTRLEVCSMDGKVVRTIESAGLFRWKSGHLLQVGDPPRLVDVETP